MSVGKAPSKARRAYKFIEAHRDEFSIQVMCRLLGIARAGYYTWLHHPVPDRALAGLVVSSSGHGSLLPQNRRLGSQADDPPGTGSGSSYESRSKPTAAYTRIKELSTGATLGGASARVTISNQA